MIHRDQRIVPLALSDIHVVPCFVVAVIEIDRAVPVKSDEPAGKEMSDRTRSKSGSDSRSCFIPEDVQGLTVDGQALPHWPHDELNKAKK